MSRALVLFSGGADSTTALYWALNRGFDSTALSFDYPGRPTGEKKAALEIANALGLPLLRAEIPFLTPAKDLPMDRLSKGLLPQSPAVGYVPMRNMVFYATAGYYAEVYEIPTIIAGHTRDDAKTYSDASPQFFDLIREVYRLTLRSSYVTDQKEVEIVLPLAGLSLRDQTALGHRLGVPFDLTWSCWYDTPEPCGSCFACRERLEAFKAFRLSQAG